MQHFALSVSRCRLSLSRPRHWFSENQNITRRFRSGKILPNKFQKRPSKDFGDGGGYANALPRSYKTIKNVREAQVPVGEVAEYLTLRVADWTKMPKMRRRLEAFGIPELDIPILLRAFRDEISEGLLTRPGIHDKYTLDRFAGSYTGPQNGRIDEVLTNIFYAWASDPDYQPFLETIVPATTIHGIIQLRAAADQSYPADLYQNARSIRRQFYMHVGPTNSGKTHMALRALAAAGTGVYAGPLRLLAHEVWESLNKGQIVPLGMGPDADAEPDTETVIDTMREENSGRPTLRKQGNQKYVRRCNLITGEEAKIVADNAALLSCTVEMISTSILYDVAVVDEIQMIASSDRGGGWTRAVLGLFAKEIHLCGEETAIPIIQALVKETGDELIIKRYNRLTPLIIQDQTLEGDLSRVQKGDCIVTFTRSGIFALKRQVEELTGMRCAVAYGRLPPEIRSEQAALFNDPESGYDVMIGSDAIGMGLNLKIKRVVFEALHKFDGAQECQLSDSQIKQIAGRAGRYGMHDDNEAAGFVTTLRKNDLPILRRAIAAPVKPIRCAYTNALGDSSKNAFDCLPLGSPISVLVETTSYVSRTRWPYQHQFFPKAADICDFIDTRAGDLTLEDKIMLIVAPVSWRDRPFLDVLARFCHNHHNNLQVNLIQCLQEGDGPLYHLEEVEASMKHGPPQSSQQALNQLECLHKLLVFYMWMHLRLPVTWCDHNDANDLKERTERALDWCLQRISWGRQSRHLPDITALRRKAGDDRIAYANQQQMRKRKELRRDEYVNAGRERAGY